LHIAVLVPAGGKEQKRQRKNENKKTKNLHQRTFNTVDRQVAVLGRQGGTTHNKK